MVNDTIYIFKDNLHVYVIKLQHKVQTFLYGCQLTLLLHVASIVYESKNATITI